MPEICRRTLLGLWMMQLAPWGRAQPPAARRSTIVVPFPVGGPADVAARVLQPLLQQSLGGPVVVENHAGVGGALGVGRVLSAAADGHTLLLATLAEPILPPLTMASVRYTPADLRLVSQLSHTDLALVARPGLNLRSVDDLLAQVRDRSRKPLTYATPGNGTLYHLVTEHFKQLTGAQWLHVPYKGLAPAVNDLLGGQVDVAFLPLAGHTTDLIDSGRLQALATTGRSAGMAKNGLPVFSDMEAFKDFNYTVWTGIFVPAATPASALESVHRAIDAALQRPEFAAYMRGAGGVARRRAQPLGEAQALYEAEARRLQGMAQKLRLEVQ